MPKMPKVLNGEVHKVANLIILCIFVYRRLISYYRLNSKLRNKKG